MDLEELFDYKNKLMEDLCKNEKVVKLVTENEEAAVPNHQLPYTQLFTYEFIPETVSEARTFICFDEDIVSVSNKTYYVPILYVWICTHKSKLRMSGGGVLLDRLSIEINKMLNGSRFYGLGQLELSSVQRFEPITDYLGRVLVYRTVDFNRLSAGARTPSNRKRGL